MLTDTRSPHPASGPSQVEEDLRRHAAEHASLRRVATLIAHEGRPADVFAAVAKEVALTLGVPLTAVIRFGADGSGTQVGAWGKENPFPVGTCWRLDKHSVSGQVARTQRPARVDDYSAIPGEISSRLAREAGIHTAVGVPIVVEGNLWGAMMALSTAEQPLAEDVDGRLIAFTELVATAIANTQARDDLRRLADEQAAQRRVATLVARGATPDEVFAAVAEEVAHVLDVPAISMVRFEGDESSTAIAIWGDGNPFGVGATFAPWPGVMLEVRQTGQPARLEDFAYSTGPTTARLQRARIHSGVGVPITVEGSVWGTIIALATGGGSLSSDIAERLSSFTDLVATAIANTQARDDLRRLAEEQAALRRVATLVAQETEPSAVFDTVAAEVEHLFDVEMTSILRYELDGASVKVGGSGHNNPFPVGSRLAPSDGVIPLVWQTGHSARIDDYRRLADPIAKRLCEAGIHSSVGVPIVVNGAVWGTMVVLSADPARLPPGTEERLSRFTELVATAIANAQARDDLRRLVDEQAALRRVATLVAEGAPAPQVFAAVAREVAEFSGLPLVEIGRFDPDGWLTVIGSEGEHPFPTGTRWPLDNPTGSAGIRETGHATRIHYTDDLPGVVAQELRSFGIRWAVGVPIVVDGKAWGSIGGAIPDGGPLPVDAEDRLIGFSELISTAISNAQTRNERDVFVREQEALRRVATLAASGASPQEVFDAVVEEVKELLDLPVVALTRYEPDGMVLMMASAGPHPFEKGTRWPVEGLPVASMVLERGEPAYLEEYVTDDPTTGLAIESAKVRSGLAVPIMVDNKVWGTISTASTDLPLPPDIEKRLVGFTELVATAVLNAQARDELSDIADEQAALRRVATLVAEGAGSPAVYDAICQETGPVIGATSVNLCHFTTDRSNLTMAGWSVHDTHIPTGTRLPIEGGTINELVYYSAAAARIESYADAEGALADLIRERGIKSEVAAPVIVDGRLWGAIIAGWDTDGPPPSRAEQRLAGFAEIVATAVSNALTRSELVASRARIVTAADEARRVIERNLHDGVQQQLVALQLELKTVEAEMPAELEPKRQDLERLQGVLENVLDDVREISQGVHPATLSQWGLGPALRTLTRRSPIPIELEINVSQRLPDSVEIAAYYVVSEALANVSKHAQASYARVEVTLDEGWLRASIRDDGIGGADTARGSGLTGLVDRVEALGGRLTLTSAPKQGTTVTVALPVSAEAADDL